MKHYRLSSKIDLVKKKSDMRNESYSVHGPRCVACEGALGVGLMPKYDKYSTATMTVIDAGNNLWCIMTGL